MGRHRWNGGACVSEETPQMGEFFSDKNRDGVSTGLKPTDQARRNDHENHNHRNRNRHSNRCPWSCDHWLFPKPRRMVFIGTTTVEAVSSSIAVTPTVPAVITTTVRTITEVAVLSQVPMVPVLAVTTVVVDASLLIHRSIANQAISPRQHRRGFLFEKQL